MYKLLILLISAIILATFVCRTVFADPVPQTGSSMQAKTRPGLGGQIERELNLTDSQTAQLGPLLKSAREQFKAIREDSTLTQDQKAQKIAILRPQIESQINKILTPAQQKELAAVRAKMQQEHPNWTHDGPPHHPGWDHNGPLPHPDWDHNGPPPHPDWDHNEPPQHPSP